MTTNAKPEAQAPNIETLEQEIAALKQEMMNVAKAGDFETLRAKTQELNAKEKIVHDLLAAKVQEERVKRHAALEQKAKTTYAGDIDNIRKFGPILRVTIDASPELPEPVYTAVLGSHATPSHKSGGATTSAPRGKTSERYGMSLDQVFRQYATPEEMSAHDALPADKNSAKWNIKRGVLKRAEEGGLLKPIS